MAAIHATYMFFIWFVWLINHIFCVILSHSYFMDYFYIITLR